MGKTTYADYVRKEMELARDIPIFWAFTTEQFEAELEKHGLKMDECQPGDIIGLKGGGFCFKEDYPTVKAYFNRKNELLELMEDEDFALEAFVYEMGNHEYHINYYQGDWDVCNVFCSSECTFGEDKDYRDYLREGGFSDNVIKYYTKALHEYYKQVREEEGF